MLCEWLVKRCREQQASQVSQRHILLYGPNRVRDREQRDRALGILEDHGMVRQATEGRKGMIEVNPSLTK